MKKERLEELRKVKRGIMINLLEDKIKMEKEFNLDKWIMGHSALLLLIFIIIWMGGTILLW